jgi:hypothetical protein
MCDKPGMDTPSPKALADASGISPSYASMILSEGEHRRVPPRSLAILLFRKTNWKHPSIADLTEAQMRVFEEVDPWTPRTQDEAA